MQINEFNRSVGDIRSTKQGASLLADSDEIVFIFGGLRLPLFPRRHRMREVDCGVTCGLPVVLTKYAGIPSISTMSDRERVGAARASGGRRQQITARGGSTRQRGRIRCLFEWRIEKACTYLVIQINEFD